MAKYHLRVAERAIKSRKAMLDIIESGRYMTIAMCKGEMPYLVAVNHSFDRDAKCLYFHCASEGRKTDYLAANPRVWGQVIEDGGYIGGKCDYAYRSVMFSGSAEVVTDIEEKRRALSLLIDKLERDPESMRRRLLTVQKLKKVTVYRINVREMTGKESVRK